jgi:hypothetical protein
MMYPASAAPTAVLGQFRPSRAPEVKRQRHFEPQVPAAEQKEARETEPVDVGLLAKHGFELDVLLRDPAQVFT